MKTLLKLLALLPFVVLAASIALKSFREHVPINAALALMVPWWIVLFLVYVFALPKEEGEAAKREWTFYGGEAAKWPTKHATIKHLQATIMSQGKGRLVAFTLEVPGDPSGPRTIEQRQLVPDLAFSQLRVGSDVVVHVSPADPDQIFIDWNQSYPGSLPKLGADASP